jgi:hypothetical protein
MRILKSSLNLCVNSLMKNIVNYTHSGSVQIRVQFLSKFVNIWPYKIKMPDCRIGHEALFLNNISLALPRGFECTGMRICPLADPRRPGKPECHKPIDQNIFVSNYGLSSFLISSQPSSHHFYFQSFWMLKASMVHDALYK